MEPKRKNNIINTIEVTQPDEWVFDANNEIPRPYIKKDRKPRKKNPLFSVIFWILLVFISFLAGYFLFYYLPAHNNSTSLKDEKNDIQVSEKPIISQQTESESPKQVNTITTPVPQAKQLPQNDEEALKKASEIKKQEAIRLEREAKERERQKKEAQARLQKNRREQLLKKKDDDAFRKAIAANSIYSFQKYIDTFPNGYHIDEVKNRRDQLVNSTQLENRIRDDVQFETASGSNTIAAYEEYLKSFPYGIHAAESKNRIASLKQKILKETKDKLEITSIRFFAAGARTIPPDQRKFSSRFPLDSTSYIYTELKFKNKLFRVDDASIAITIEYAAKNGSFKQQLKGVIQTGSDTKDGMYSRGVGWAEPGKWPLGKYTVSVYFDNILAVQSGFELF